MAKKLSKEQLHQRTLCEQKRVREKMWFARMNSALESMREGVMAGAVAMLTDIRHLCDEYDESFTTLDELAESQYLDEKLEMERGRQHD